MSTLRVVRPDFVEQEYLEYLDELVDSGVTNMFGATPYLEYEFPELTQKQARSVVSYWMTTYEQRHPGG